MESLQKGSLPLPVLCKQASQQGLRCCRVALLSCCAEFWRRPELLQNPALWGDLTLGDDEIWPKHRKTSLAAWLLRRQACRRRLCLSFVGLGFVGGPTSLLDSLTRGSLADLRLTSTWVQEPVHGSFEAAFEPLRDLLGLTRLELSSFGLDLGGSGLPDPVSLLTGLAELDLRRNACRTKGAGVLTLLHQLTTLTRLDLGECFLRSVPAAVSALKSLRALGLGGNGELGKSGEDAWKPLQQLTSLTFLDAANCGLSSVLHTFARLSSLRHLALGGNSLAHGGNSLAFRGNTLFMAGVEEGLHPLFVLTALTCLDFRGCGFLPQDVSSMRSMLETRGGCLMLT